MQKKRSDQKLSFKTNCVKKRSRSRAFKMRSKSVQNRSRLRNILRKTKGFSRSVMAWFRLFTRKSITGRTKAIGKTVPEQFFFKMVKTKFFENGLEKPNLEGYQVYVHTHTYIYVCVCITTCCHCDLSARVPVVRLCDFSFTYL